MALLGVLAILQIVFLPGYLLTRALRLRGGTLTTLVLAFALSLIANHVLVVGLVVLGIYRPALVYAVFAAETAALLWIQRRSLQTSAIDAGRFRWATFSVRSRNRPCGEYCWPPRWSLSRDLPSPAWPRSARSSSSGTPSSPGTVGRSTGPRTACPTARRLYPQLLPTNVSLTYVFMQTSNVWIFAKAFQFLFCLMLLLAMLDAARVTGNFGFVPGLLITYWLLVAVLRFRMIGSGYADMPLAFFSFAAVYALLLAKHAGTTEMRPRYVMVGAGWPPGRRWPSRPASISPRSIRCWRGCSSCGTATQTPHAPDDVITAERDEYVGALLRVALLIGVLVAPGISTSSPNSTPPGTATTRSVW